MNPILEKVARELPNRIRNRDLAMPSRDVTLIGNAIHIAAGTYTISYLKGVIERAMRKEGG